MSMKASGAGSVNEVDRWDGGAGWLAHPDERMQRASHALVDDGDVWLVDPVDAEGLDEWLAEMGEVAGVLVLLDRHKRDSAALARRHDVAVHVPEWMSGVATKLDAPTERFDGEVAGWEVRRLVDNPFWQEAALYRADERALVVPESFGTVDYYCAPGERLGVHPFRRLTPPKRLRRLDVDHLLVGHGAGIHDDPDGAIRDALRGARTRAPKLYLSMLRSLIS